MLSSRLLGALLLLTGVDNYELFQRDEPRASAGAHHVAKKDLRIDLSVPSLGVLLSHRLHRKASLVAQPESEVKPTSGTTTENHANDVEGRDSPGNDEGGLSGSGEVSRHRGRFGEGMFLRTRVVTFPTVHKHEDDGKDMRGKAIMRQWKDLMGSSRESRVQSPPDRLPHRPKVKRRAGDASLFDLRRSPSTPQVSTANASAVVCNCSELLANKTFEELLILVPTLSKTLGETGSNGTVIREFIRASLSKSVLVERIYEEGCRCSCNGTETLPRPTTTVTEKTTTGSMAHPPTTRSYRTIVTRSQHTTTTTTARTTSTATTPKSREPPQEIRMPPTTPSPTRIAAGRSSSKCPKRVFVKFPGEQLPARARDCRKLWLPENVSNEETFWECEDEGSIDCGGRQRITASTGLVFFTRFAETSLTTSLPATTPRTTTSRTTCSTSPSTTTRAPSTSQGSKMSERTSPSATPHDCDDSAPATAGAKKTPRLATTKVLNSTGGWHLNVHIPFYTFRSTRAENATHLTEATPEKVRHRHYTATVASTTKSSPTASSRRSSLTTMHTTRSSIAKSAKTRPAKTLSTTTRRPSMKAISSKTSKSTPRRKYSTETPVPGTLVTTLRSSASNSSVCNGAGCQKATPLTVESPSTTTHHPRSTHHHLHDDYDFAWARPPSPSPERPARVIQYRVGANTVFPYPYREYEATAAVKDRYPILIVTNTSAERRSHVHNSIEGAFFERKDGARTSTARTTHVRYVIGMKDSRELEQGRLAYKSYYRNVASRDVQRRGADRAVGSQKSGHVNARKGHRPNRVLERAKHAQESTAAPLPPVKIDLLKSRISLNAMVNKVKNSARCRSGGGCSGGKRAEFVPGGFVVRTSPAQGDEYEYYYVYYELPDSEDPALNEPPYLATTNPAGKAERSGSLERSLGMKKKPESKRAGHGSWQFKF